jgi:hypothetical protein
VCYPWFEETPDISETPIRSRIISGTWMPIMTHVHLWRSFVAWTVNVDVLFLLFLWYLQCLRSERWYHHTLFSLVTDMCYLTRSHDILSMWPSHMLRGFGWNLTEWAQSIFPSCGRTNPALNTYASTYPIGIPDKHQSPSNRVTSDVIKATSG